MKLVSVVVATYRRTNELKTALDSLANQSYTNFEIVLVDDNAEKKWNMEVKSIVDTFLREFPEIRLNFIVNYPNQGSAKTRNIGINNSKGEYITFLDDDDVYLPEKINNQVRFMEIGGYDYSITDLVLYNEDDKEIDRRTRSYIKNTSVASLKMYHLMYHMTGTDTMMFKMEYLKHIGGFAPIDVGDEFYLMQRAIEGGGKFGYLHICDVKAYVHNGQIGLSSGDSKIKGENALYEYKKQYFNEINFRSRLYIKMRHHAVLAFAYKRIGKTIQFLKHGIISFFCSPIGCAKLIISRKI